MEQIRDFLREFGVLIGVGVVGVGILIYGLWGVIVPEPAIVEIVKGEVLGQEGERTEVVVDIAGEVEKPGLYKLPSGSRIGDALVMAGGLSASADREWVAKTLNLAEVVKDGGKVYVPKMGVTERETSLSAQAGSQNNGNGVTLGSKVNINTASMGELDSLTGIGEVRAKTILDNRPYSKTEDLVSKAKIPQSVYDKIKDQVSVY